MKAFLFGLVVFSIWTAFARYYYVCNIKQQCIENVSEPGNDQRLNSLALTFGDSILMIFPLPCFFICAHTA